MKLKEQKINIKKYNIKTKFIILIFALLVIIALLSGITMLFFGIRDVYKFNKETKDYKTTNGYYNTYDIYSSDEDGITYKLIYVYTVDGIEYSVTTDYGTAYIPEKNSSRGIKYNPNSPEEAILTGMNGEDGLIYFGAFFTLISLSFIIFALSESGCFDRFKIDIHGVYIGFVLFIMGIGTIILLHAGTTSLIETIKGVGMWIVIPIMFIVVGIIQIVKCLFNKKIKM